MAQRQPAGRASTATESVGGSAITFVPGPVGTENETLAIGEQGATRQMLPQVEGAASTALGHYTHAQLRPVGYPDFSSLEQSIDRLAQRAVQADEAAEGKGSLSSPGPYFQKFYRERATNYRQQIATYTAHRYREEDIVAGYNRWYLRANLMFAGLARLQGMQDLLGVSAPEAMVAALVDSLGDAQRAAGLAQIASPGALDLPAVDAQVGSAAGSVTSAARRMGTTWLGYQQVTSARRVERLQASGEVDEAELAEIKSVIETFRDIGTTIDVAIAATGKPVEVGLHDRELAEAVHGRGASVARPLSIPTDAAGVLGGIAGLVYEDEIHEIEQRIGELEAKISAEQAVADEFGVTQKVREFKNAVTDYKVSAVRFNLRLVARRESYLKLGEQIDEAAKQIPETRREGIAPDRGGERFSTVMLMTSAVREVLALGRAAAEGHDSPDEIRNELMGIVGERRLLEPEYRPLVSVHAQTEQFHANLRELDRVLGPVEVKAAAVMARLLGQRAPDVGGY
ncbi:MAG: hypothetical protein ACR2NA_11380 [Solirubrobacterales bacterium]